MTSGLTGAAVGGHTMNEGVLVIDKKGEILHSNQSARALLGLDEKCSGESLDFLRPFFDDPQPDSISRHESTARITLGDGTNRFFRLSTSALDSDGSLLVIFQDVSAASEIEERKRRARELALVGEMASRLSHEIKNPLASILVAVKILQRDIPESSEHGNILQLMSEEVNSLGKVISELLELARQRTFHSSAVDVESLLQRCVDARRSQADRLGVRLVTDPARVSVTVLVDDQAMLRALCSIIQNALDASSRGGLIHIGWREVDQARRDALVPGFSANIVSLFVEDEGVGVPDELSSDDSRLFEAFVSTKVSRTGLGLTVAQEIVEQNGGVIVVIPLAEKGTRVEILLPIHKATPCWAWNGDRSVDCVNCHVESEGKGSPSRKQKPNPCHEATGPWPERCLKCEFFRASSLSPFFRSRLVLSKVE